MMAKMFYTLEEAKAALGKNEEEIKQFTREGRLREFRDGPRLMFKADQVESLKNELGVGGGGAPDIGPSDSGGPIGLVDSRTASASGISLVDTDLSGRGGAGGSASGVQLKDDTGMASGSEIGLLGSTGGSMGGSVTGVPSPARPGGSAGSMAGTRAGSGINVLGDSVVPADPSAQTAISGAGVPDQISLEGTGSGSGLLDLTRESDDTSLGAELLDEIAPGGSKRGSKAGAISDSSATAATGVAESLSEGTAVGEPSLVGRRGTAGVPVYVEAPDASAGFFAGAALAATIMVGFAGFALVSAVLDTRPPLLQAVDDMSMLILLGIGAGTAVVFGVAGWLAGRALSR